jgi:hypothetical protein
LIIVDSQAVHNTCNASVESKGFCFYKATNGIKRHLAVDTLGFPFFTHCTSANVSDDAGLVEMLTQNIDYGTLKTDEHSEDHYLIRSWLSSGAFNTGATEGVSRHHAED